MDGRRGFVRKMAGGAYMLTLAGHASWILQGPPKLTNGWDIFNPVGQILFPIYGPSGGLAETCILYLVRPLANGSGMDVIPLEFDAQALHEADKDEMRKIVFDRIDAAIKADKYKTVKNGGDLGREHA